MWHKNRKWDRDWHKKWLRETIPYNINKHLSPIWTGSIHHIFGLTLHVLLSLLLCFMQRCQWLKLHFARGLPRTGPGIVPLTGATIIASIQSMFTPENVIGMAMVSIVIMLATVSTTVESLLFSAICNVLCIQIKANNSLELHMCRQ